MNRMALTWARWMARRIGASYPMCRVRFLQTDACCSYARTHMAQSFDAASRQTVGEAIPIAENVSSTTSISLAPVTVSETGVLLYQSGGNIFVDQMAWYDRTGKIVEAVVDRTRARVVAPAISPDARSVVFGRFGIAADLWLLGRGTAQRLTTDGSLNGVAVWSRKGDRIAFNSNRDGGVFNLYQRTANVTGHDELLLATANTKGPTQWSRDGRFLIYSESDPKTKWDIWLLPMDHGAERKPIPFLRSQSNEFQGQVSPDGHWIAYTSDESSQNEVYVRAFPAAERQWKISIVGGEQPRWSGDGKELFFISPEGKMMAIAVKVVLGASPTFEPSKPQLLFEAHTAQPLFTAFGYDVTADGRRYGGWQRFLVVMNTRASGSAPVLNVMVNWDASLKK